MTTFNPLADEEVVEVIHCARTGNKWHFSSATVSPLWLAVMSERWEHLQDAPYYREFYKHLIPVLDSQESKLVELHATLRYTYGAVPERDVPKYMNDWRDDWQADKLTQFLGEAVMVSQRSNDPDRTISLIRMTPLSYTLEPLDE